MSFRCPACSAEQQLPAPGATSMCMRCGEKMTAPASPASAGIPSAKAAAAPGGGRDDEFNQQTMSMMRPDLSAVGEGLPALSALVAAAASEIEPRTAGEQKVWHIRTGAGADMGPATQQEVTGWQAAGKLDAATLAWRPGMEQWLPLKEALAQSTAAAVPPPPPGASKDGQHSAGATDSFFSAAPSAEATHASDGNRPKTTVRALSWSRRTKTIAAAAAASAIVLAAGLFLFARGNGEQQASVASHVNAPASEAPTAPAAAAPAVAAPAAVVPAPAVAAPVGGGDAIAADPADSVDEPAPEPEEKPKASKRRKKHRRGHRRSH